MIKTNSKMAAGKLHEQHVQQKTDDESAADHDDEFVIQDQNIFNLSEINHDQQKTDDKTAAYHDCVIIVPDRENFIHSVTNPWNWASILSSCLSICSRPSKAVSADFTQPDAPKSSFYKNIGFRQLLPKPMLETVPESSFYKDRDIMMSVEKSSFYKDMEIQVNVSKAVRRRNIIIVRPRRSTIENYPHILLEDLEESFPEEAAVCKFCFDTFEPENMFMTKCKCPNALTHEECIRNWSAMQGNNNCSVCDEEVKSFSVEWHLKSSQSTVEPPPKPRKKNWIGRLIR